MQRDLLVTLDRVDAELEGRRILSGVSWEIRRQENWLVAGPNGAGKTTLLRILRGLLWPAPSSHGRRLYHFEGEESESPVGLERRMHYVSPEMQQRYQQQDWDLNGGEIVVSGFEGQELLYEAPSRKSTRRAGDLMERFGATGLAEKALHAMSQGELRKILILRALVGEPGLLILDEICSGLDAAARNELLRFIDAAACGGTQLVMTAHRTEELIPAITHVLRIDGGQVLEAGPVGQGLRKKAFAARNAKRKSASRQRADTGKTLLCVENADVFLDLKPRGFHQALRAVNWEVREGEHWAVTGPNGSGKSTLLRLIYGDVTCAAGGTVKRFEPQGDLSVLESRSRMGYFSAELQARFETDVTVRQAVASGFFSKVGAGGRLSVKRARAAAEVLERFGITAFAGRRLSQLSYGQMRRALLARAVVHRPELLLLDEPLDGLDPGTRSDVLAVLEELPRAGTTLVMVSHHEEDFPDIVTKRLSLEDGRVADIEEM